MLVSMKSMFEDAVKKKYAVGAFNVPNLESVIAVITAAEEEGIPVIVQHAEGHENLISVDIIGKILLDFAKRATVPVCVHLDHGASFDMCMKAIKMGFTSVMYDGSAKSFEENVAETKEIVKIAHSLGISVEAELGHIFTSSIGAGEGREPTGIDSFNSKEDCYTDPTRAKEFVERTGVDSLAIAFGTTHGVYVTKPVLDLDRITQIKNKINIPLVMHGGSGVSEADFRVAIKNGITKVNYYTYMSMAGGDAVVKSIKKDEKVFFHDISTAAINGMKDDVKKAMRIFYGK